MFADIFAAHAARPCLWDGGPVLSYAETLALGRARIAGLAPRSFVVLRCDLTIETVATYAALVVDGHVPLLLEDSLAPELVTALVTAYRPDAMVGPDGIVPGPGGTTLHPDLALLLSTSGSTGSAKLVRHTAAGLHANAAAIAEYLTLDAAERPLLHLPMSYSFGLSVIHSHFVAGACVGLTRSAVMEPGYWDDLAAFRATSVAGVPFHFAALRRFGEAKLDLPDLKTLSQAGGRLDPKLVTWFADWAQRTGRRFFVMYGQTEAGPRIAYLPPERAAAAPEAIGVPIPGVAIDLDEGELVVRSPAVMMGYATAAADLARGDEMGGVLRTGDVGELGDDGLLRITGRNARMVKVYGLRVGLDEVETRLSALGHTAFCFGGEDRLCVLLEDQADAAAVRGTVVELFSLPPRGIEVRRALAPVPRTPAGKIAAASLAKAWSEAAA